MIGRFNNHIFPVTIFFNFDSQLIFIIKSEFISLTLNMGIIYEIYRTFFDFIYIMLLSDSLNDDLTDFHTFWVQVTEC